MSECDAVPLRQQEQTLNQSYSDVDADHHRMMMDPSVTTYGQPKIVQKSMQAQEKAFDGNTSTATIQEKEVDKIEASQQTLDGVTHKLSAGSENHEGMMTENGIVDGFENGKIKATYQMQHPDGRTETFNVGGVEDGVLKMTPNAITAQAQAKGHINVE